MRRSPLQPNCLQCRHYYITWDETFPYGCRALQFKSRILPMLEVQQASGEPCHAFFPKDATAVERKGTPSIKMRLDIEKGRP